MSTFDRSTARLLLEICRYTYAAAFTPRSNAGDLAEALQAINQAGRPEGIVLLTDDKDISTSVACVVAYPNRNVVAYMGTKSEFTSLENAIESIHDWTRNIEIAPVPFALDHAQLGADLATGNNLGGRVHRGFLKELAAIQAKVVAALMARGGTGRPLLVTGHSQGGALACLATRAFQAAAFQVAATYTFAAPRPGNAEFAKSIPPTHPLHRIEFGNDIVPHVPPTRIGLLRQLSMKYLPLLTDKPGSHRQFLRELAELAANSPYVSVGALCYGDAQTKTLRVDMSDKAADALFYPRLWSLVRHNRDWGDHHHLAGTDADVQAGRKGNYTALVSDYAMQMG